MKYTQITQALDWFYVHDDPTKGGDTIVYPVAVWAVCDDGAPDQRIVGLIAVNPPSEDGRKHNLSHVPPVPGGAICTSRS